MLQCEICGTVFEDTMDKCPHCKSAHVVGYEMDNPVSRLPMEDILRVTGHIIWIIGIIGCLVLLWNTDKDNETLNMFFAIGGFLFLCGCLVFSVTLFGMGEILKRLIRVQRRVRAFSEGYHVVSRHKVKKPEAPDTEKQETTS